MNDFQNIINLIGSTYKIEPKDYPVVGKLDENEKFNFSIAHSLKHLAKSTGKIAAELEEGDHGGTVDREKIKKATISSMISILKLCEAQGISGKELEEQIPKNL